MDVYIEPIEPSPEEIVLWYHLRIDMRIFRALAAVHGKGPESDHSDEALGSAKLVLDAIKQSKHALGSLARSLGHTNVEALRAKLDVLDCGVRERFPMADSFIGLGWTRQWSEVMAWRHISTLRIAKRPTRG